MDQDTNTGASDPGWRSLYRIGGAAAIIAGVLFRRNIAAEISLFSAQPSPMTVSGWFELLQSNRLLGLAYLNIFDLVNYVLVALMYLALYLALRRTNQSLMLVAMALGLLGIGVYLASNTALSMLSLSQAYASATSQVEAERLLAAGQALLANIRFVDAGSNPGAGGYLSLLLVAMAGLITSIVMLGGSIFNRATAYVGILAGALDLAYCLVFALLPDVNGEMLALVFIPAAGLSWMVWHILVGWRLIKLGSAG